MSSLSRSATLLRWQLGKKRFVLSGFESVLKLNLNYKVDYLSSSLSGENNSLQVKLE